MRKLLLFLASLALLLAQDPALCPKDSGLVQSGRLSFSSSLNPSIALLIPTQQTLTYNYTLSQSFNSPPGVSIAISSFQSQSSPFLMFAVKPLEQNQSSISSLTFLVRWYLRYTNWKLVSFGFVAEDRTDIEADYIQLDTGLLSTDSPAKAVKVSLPVQSKFTNASAVYFINGFQLASLPAAGIIPSNTPFEVHIQGLSSNLSSLDLVISTTTASEVYSLMVSYIVFESSSSFYFGAFQYNPGPGAGTSFLSAPVTLPANPAAQVSGVSGLMLANVDGSSSFTMELLNSSYQFSVSPGISYLNYQYFAIVPTNTCFSCQQHPLIYNTTCVATCPNATYLFQGTCYTCSPTEIWNGTACQTVCQGGMQWNATSNQCQCPPSMAWNGTNCLTCPAGQVWNTSQTMCTCPNANQLWDGSNCQTVQCQLNQYLNLTTFQCLCSPGFFRNGSICTNCTGGRLWNGNTSSCSCPDATYFNGVQCITCSGGMIFDSINNRCVCPQNQIWNGTNCTAPCTAPLVLNNQQCTCPLNTLQLSNGSCVPTPTCSTNQTWNGTSCAPISCNTGSLWNGTACVQYSEPCPLNTYWNGISCIAVGVSCPNGSGWNGTYCSPAGGCPIGTYNNSGQCQYFPVICLPSYVWNGSGCLAVGLAATCLTLQIFNGTACVPVNCSQSKVWSSTWNQCVCNSSSYWNGLSCLSCPPRQIFVSGSCVCPDGYFMIQSSCYSLKQIYCSYVSNSQWNGTNCICNPGFTVVGTTCVCYGLAVGNNCNICYRIQNSFSQNGSCVCQVGYYMFQGQCIAYRNSSNSSVAVCQAGTILSNGTCVPCSDGCLSCISQTFCVQCRPEFTYNWVAYSCLEICGDGLRFILPCDDGNNVNGDGCSSLCQIQSDYTCFGGSPNSKDTCTQAIPSKLVINLTGTSHLNGKIIVNFKSNYLPSNMTSPLTPCSYLCSQILRVAVAAGDAQYLSIGQDYFQGTFSFAAEINFGREPIGQFVLQVSIDQNIAAAYFPGVACSDTFSFTITPAFLSVYKANDKLS